MTFQPGDHVSFPNPETKTALRGVLLDFDEVSGWWTVVHATTGMRVSVPAAEVTPGPDADVDGLGVGHRVIAVDLVHREHFIGVLSAFDEHNAEILTDRGRRVVVPAKSVFHTPVSSAGGFRVGDRVQVERSIIRIHPEEVSDSGSTGTVVQPHPDHTVSVHIHVTGITERLNTVDVQFDAPATFGDWVVLPDGTLGAVMSAQPTWSGTRGGYSFNVMLRGGAERSFVAWEGEEFDAFEVVDPDRVDLKGAARPNRW